MRQINCPKCGLPGSINDIMVGKNIQCSGCSTTFMVPTEFEETEADDSTRTAVQERHRSLEAGLLALPNLALRGTFTLALLYFLLVLVLITFSEFGVLSTEVALVIGVGRRSVPVHYLDRGFSIFVSTGCIASIGCNLSNCPGTCANF